MKRQPHAHPMTRKEAERIGAYLATRQPRTPQAARPPWYLDERKVAALAIVLGVLAGVLVTFVMGDLVWVPVTP